MEFFVSPEIQEKCRDYDVVLESRVSVGALAARKINIESPARLRRGVYDIDLIGAYSFFGTDSLFYFVESIGRFCSMASNIRTGLPEHPTHFLSSHPIFQGDPAWADSAPEFLARNQATIDRSRDQRQAIDRERFGKIVIGNDVWIGEGVLIRRGIKIGDGAVIGAGSVVTRDIPPYAIVGGAPAKLIRFRFEPDIIHDLLSLQWWNYGLSALENVNFTDISMAVWGIQENIQSGQAVPYQPPILVIDPNGVDVLQF
jgi:acetyltransferase-like isoleucine patch superfamily enzyme